MRAISALSLSSDSATATRTLCASGERRTWMDLSGSLIKKNPQRRSAEGLASARRGRWGLGAWLRKRSCRGLTRRVMASYLANGIDAGKLDVAAFDIAQRFLR